MTIAFLILAGCISAMAAYRIREAHKRPRYMEQRRSMATRVQRPYAIVEAYDAQGEAQVPTYVYDADQLDSAMERYAALGCAVIVGTPLDTVH